jgi:hypothetical protein
MRDALSVRGVVLALSLPLSTLQPQRVLGALDDATVVPRGSVRVAVGISFSRADDRFSPGGIARAVRGTQEPLGASLSFDSLGPSAIEALAPVAAPLRSLSGQSALSLSLGALAVRMNRDVRTIPFSLEAGLTSRLTISALVPYVLVRNDVVAVPGGGGNVGLNPATSVVAARTRNGTVLTQLNGASTRLRAQLAACESDPSGAGCAALNANRQAALALLSQADIAALDLAAVYGTASGAGARFAPVVGSALEQAIFARLGAFNTSYQTFLGLPVDSVLIAARPVGATRLTLNDHSAILSDSAFGIAAAPLGSVEHGHVGDMEIAAKFLLYDGFNATTSRRLARGTGVKARVALAAAYRFANGTTAAPDNFADLGTGDGSPDVEGRAFVDLVVGNRYWQSIVVRYGVPFTVRLPTRIDDPSTRSFPGFYRRQEVWRTPGPYVEAELSPRLVLNDFFAVAGNYRYRRSDADQYSGVFTVTDLSGNQRTLDAAPLGAFSATEEHRAGLALSYSTLAAYASRRSFAPLELTLLLTRAVGGAGVPAASTVTLNARWYHKLFGPNNLRR